MANEAAKTEPRKSAFEGQLFRLDKFKGIEPGGWSVDWKAILNRQVAVMVGLEPKEGGVDVTLTTEQALARIGYFKASEGASAAELRSALASIHAIATDLCRPNTSAISDSYLLKVGVEQILDKASNALDSTTPA